MPLTCHAVIEKIKEKVDVTIALAGNPNVGKSVIFNRFTGLGVVTANYPGKTVELNIGTTKFDNLNVGIIDLPGTYAISAVSEDQWVARRGILEGRPDAVIVILDATNLERNLYMLLQFLDLDIPVVVALNLMDQAKKKGISIDCERLSKALGVPVIPTVAITGWGLNEVMGEAVEVAQGKVKLKRHTITYGKDIEKEIKELEMVIAQKLTEIPAGISHRALSILLLEHDPEFVELAKELPKGDEVLKRVDAISDEIKEVHGESSNIRMARERYGLSGTIIEKVKSQATEKMSFLDRLWSYTTYPPTGIPLLILVILGAFGILFYVGNFLSTVFSNFWSQFVSPVIKGATYFVFGKGLIANILLWGFDAGIEAALAVGIPFVLTFYLMLGVLEDTGYLNSMAFLTDSLMHKIGLHGRVVIPLVSGAGCSVPAIMGTRVLSAARERFIACTLIVLIPCSARTAVIIGGVSKYAGAGYAFAIYVITIIMIALVGLGLNKVMPGESTGLVMEMFPLRIPSLLTTFKKTWYRFKDFVFVAFPIVFIGSIALGALYETGYLFKVTGWMKPVVVGWLGLPLVAGLTLIFAFLRKELALELLVAFAVVQYGSSATNLLSFMTKNQLFVYGLVNTLYIPCVAAFAVLLKELGWKKTLAISTFTAALALALGGIAIRVLPALGIG